MYTRDIIHTNDAVANLFQRIDVDRFPHALLLKGPAGSGKLMIARALAQYLICENKSEKDSCGKCQHCHKSLKSIHPDIHFSFPITGAKVTCNDFMNDFRSFIMEQAYASGSDWIMRMGEGKKTGNITAAECNRLSHIVHLKPYESDKKIVIIWLPEFLGKEGNRLLKMIEEPPPETYFIFVSDQADMILGTILSRCQIVNIAPVSTQVMADIISEKFSLQADDALTIANLSDGNINEAFAISQNSDNKFLPIWMALFRAAYQGHSASIVKAVNDLNEFTKEEMKTFFQYCTHFLRQCLLLRYLPSDQVILPQQELDLAQKVISVVDDEAIQRISTMLDELSYHLDRNANMKVSLLNFAIQTNKTLKKDAVMA